MPRIYSRHVFPTIMDWTMSREGFSKLRAALLVDLRGTVLEIGFGTGLNAAYYPETVTQLFAIDPNPGMGHRARKRIRQARVQVEHRTLNGESLPFANGSLDSVVSTWTLCSISDVDQALREVHRVLKPNGDFRFLEHGLSDEPRLQKWQRCLTPVQRVIGDGCHLDRDIEKLVSGAGFQIRHMETFYMDSVPRVGGYMYKGIAGKPTRAEGPNDGTDISITAN